MAYETEGYVQSVKMFADSPIQDGLALTPTGSHLIEKDGLSFCLFNATTANGNIIDAKLFQFDKNQAVSMRIKAGLQPLKSALVMAKTNHTKVRVGVDGSFFGGSSQKDPTITTIEFI